jgi:8-oxo-dGTP pyrophosphatase MutT (NUDIX family)
MIEPVSVTALVEAAGMDGDGEAEKSRELILMLLAKSVAPFSRYQFEPGHITCTGLVLSPDRGQVLLVHHRRLDRWLLPGGHVEPEDDAIWDAARREVIEETGACLSGADDRLLSSANPPPLISLDVHGIPPRRNEPYHLHHDLIFFFQAIAETFEVSEESRAVAWCAPDDFDRYSVPGNVRRAWARSLNHRLA